jgi:sugar phosphate permease
MYGGYEMTGAHIERADAHGHSRSLAMRGECVAAFHDTTLREKEVSSMNIVRPYALLFGVVLTLVGILGFVGALAPDGRLLGIFAIDSAHNIVHIASGLVGLLAYVGGARTSRLYAGVFGAVYALVTVIGFVQMTSVLGLITINTADNVLHAAIALVSLAVFAMAGGKQTAAARA